MVLAQKEFIKVTGVRLDREVRATASYAYRWVPTQIGKHLQAVLKLPQMADAQNFPRYFSYTRDWKGELEGQEDFALYEDGWRLEFGLNP